MSLTFEYDTAYHPPAPVIEIGVRRAGREQPEELVQALVDSGADATMLPKQLLVALSARRASGDRYGVSVARPIRWISTW